MTVLCSLLLAAVVGTVYVWFLADHTAALYCGLMIHPTAKECTSK